MIPAVTRKEECDGGGGAAVTSPPQWDKGNGGGNVVLVPALNQSTVRHYQNPFSGPSSKSTGVNHSTKSFWLCKVRGLRMYPFHTRGGR